MADETRFEPQPDEGTAPDEAPETDTAPGNPVPPQPARQPVWTAFLTPAAVLVGAAVIAAVLWLRIDDDGANTATVAGTPANPTPDGSLDGGATTVQRVGTAFADYARQLGMDGAAFSQCFEDVTGAATINAHLELGVQLGINGTPSFVINDKLIVGAQPAAVFDEVIAAELSETPPDAAEDYSPGIQQLAASGRFAVLSPAQTALIDVGDAVVFGDREARVLIAEFSDFQCPFCRRWEQDYGQALRARLGGDIALAFFHFPIQQIHPNAPFASIAAVCAADQGRFWEMHDLLFARQDEWAGLPR